MSDITQQQFDREDFFPVVWPWSISVFTFYTLYTCIIIPLVIWRSDFHPLKSRSKGYLFVMIFTQYLMVSILSLRLIIGRQIFPCALYYVFAFFGVPSFLYFSNFSSVYGSLFDAVVSVDYGDKTNSFKRRNGQL
jgi:hypothetical protein